MRHLFPSKIRQNKSYAQLKFLLILVIVLFAIGTAGYSFLHQISPVDAFGLTAETMAFAHHETDSAGRAIEVFLMLFGVIVFWFAVWTLFDLVLQGKLGELWRDLMSSIQVGQLKNHYVICGAGRVGIHVAELLQQKKLPYVIVEKDKALVDLLSKKGFLVIQGDALEEEALKEADIEKAKAIVAVIPETEKNVLITLIAKHMNPDILAYARAEKEEMIKQLHHAGVKHVVTPEIAGARELMSLIAKEEGLGAAPVAAKK